MNRTPLVPVISIIHGMHTARANDPIPSKSGAHLEKLIPKAAELRIDRIAKVIQPAISPSYSHHIPASGAQA